jgi:hypothetical protein
MSWVEIRTQTRLIENFSHKKLSRTIMIVKMIMMMSMTSQKILRKSQITEQIKFLINSRPLILDLVTQDLVEHMPMPSQKKL